jgi:hypothetical protein
MAVADRNGLPVSVYVESATPHEVTLAMSTLFHLVVPDAPQNLVADHAYDSDCLVATALNSSPHIVGIERTRPRTDVG